MDFASLKYENKRPTKTNPNRILGQTTRPRSGWLQERKGMGRGMGTLKTRGALSLQAGRRAWDDAPHGFEAGKQCRTQKRQLLRGGQAIISGQQFNLASRVVRGNLAAPL